MSQQRLRVDAGRSSGDVIVRVQDVTKEYGSLVATDDVSFTVRDGEFLTLLGPSGAGKSTLLHMIAGFVKPTSGDIFIDGINFTDKPTYERNLGMVFQDLALFPHMTVKENIAFPLKMRRVGFEDIENKVSDALDLVRLPPEYADNKINELSGGEQQRVALARATVFEPAALLLDEPLSSLDKKLREEMQTELTRIHKETGQTIIHVTHNQKEALRMSDRIAVINDGSIEQLANAYDLYTNPKTPFVASFIGQTTLFEGEVISVEEGMGGTCKIGDYSVDYQSDGGKEVGDSIQIAVRAEDVIVGDEDIGTDNKLEAEVVDAAFEGDGIQYHTDIIGTEYTMDIISDFNNPDETFSHGDKIFVGWDQSNATAF